MSAGTAPPTELLALETVPSHTEPLAAPANAPEHYESPATAVNLAAAQRAAEELAQEAELIRLAQTNDPEAVALHKVIKRHLPDLRRTVTDVLGSEDHGLIEDVLWYSFTKAWESIGRFVNQGRGAGPWLHTIVRNAATSAARNRGTRWSHELLSDPQGTEVGDAFLESVFDMRPPRGPSPYEELETSLLAEWLLNRVSAEHRTILTLAIGETTYEEMAKVLDVSVGTVKSRLSRARAAARAAALALDSPDNG